MLSPCIHNWGAIPFAASLLCKVENLIESIYQGRICLTSDSGTADKAAAAAIYV